MNIEKVNILGTEYKVNMVQHPDEELFCSHADGRTNFEEKTIVVWDGRKDTERTFIHELVHAYLYESGLTAKTFDEDVVEYLTTMFEKIRAIMEKQNEQDE